MCVYNVYVHTGDIFKAGTDSNICVVLGNTEGTKFKISNLVSWSTLMGHNYDYFKMGRLDIFSRQGPCLKGWVRIMDLLSDDTGLFSD
ncbi:hypothetical protein SUGI_0589810 [Cryptomeria japonica]|nr:hypothetical protein SUGI_0589810 [Cryptomeria japonica]